jgi:hypothetical protein
MLFLRGLKLNTYVFLNYRLILNIQISNEGTQISNNRINSNT